MDPAWYDPSSTLLDVGRWDAEDYHREAGVAALHLPTQNEGAAYVIELTPGNWTRYVLVLSTFDAARNAMLRSEGRGRAALSVVWLDTGRGWVFTLEPMGILHEDYVADKLGGTVSDGWVIGRFLTALREKLDPTKAGA